MTTKIEDGSMLGLKIKKLEKESDGLRGQIEDNRVHFERKKEEEISDLRSRLTLSFKERVSGERKIYEGKISELEKKLIDQEISKDNEVFKMPVSSNQELASIKGLYAMLSDSQGREREEFEGMLQQKNKELQQVLEEKSRN